MPKKSHFSSIELFSGAGGLAIGLHAAGFKHKLLVESNSFAHQTLISNQQSGFSPLDEADISKGNVAATSLKSFCGNIDLVAGGPPCQPFSDGGKGCGESDVRDMFPQAIRAVAEVMPKAFLFENVRGLTRAKFHNYLNYIKLRLEYPHFPISERKNWADNFCRLQRYKTSSGSKKELCYNVFTALVNAADYGVPQKRSRFFVVGFRADLDLKWSFPQPTHSKESLQHCQNVSGEYWSAVGVKFSKRSEHKSCKTTPTTPGLFPALLPWRTVRQAISDLPAFNTAGSKQIYNHEFRPGARQYPGHTGSDLDEPSKTIKAGNHGVPGGENMLKLPNGCVRYFSLRECARLQTFPDDYEFHGGWMQITKQIGNAVPVSLAKIVGDSISASLSKLDSKK